ncbi:MAG: hypothetical protein GY740_00050 [Gammaproteobacteria bacterium]|nr:hypothetical protein [Gammaproteobacteria bacterium]
MLVLVVLLPVRAAARRADDGAAADGCDYDKGGGRLYCDIGGDGRVTLPAFKDGVARLLLRCDGRPHARLLTGVFQEEVGRPFEIYGDCVGWRRGPVDGSWLLSSAARIKFRRLGVGLPQRVAAGVAVDVAAAERAGLRVQLGEGPGALSFGPSRSTYSWC